MGRSLCKFVRKFVQKFVQLPNRTGLRRTCTVIRPRSKHLYVMVSHDLRTEVYWTGAFRDGQPVTTRDLRRAALFDAGSKAWAGARRLGGSMAMCDWECRRIKGEGRPRRPDAVAGPTFQAARR